MKFSQSLVAALAVVLVASAAFGQTSPGMAKKPMASSSSTMKKSMPAKNAAKIKRNHRMIRKNAADIKMMKAHRGMKSSSMRHHMTGKRMSRMHSASKNAAMIKRNHRMIRKNAADIKKMKSGGAMKKGM